jgi:hypothetical protein
VFRTPFPLCVLHACLCFWVAGCSNEQPLAPQQLFLMSLICNVHPSSQFLDVLPPVPLQLQQQPGGAGLSAVQQQMQMQREAAAGGDEELLQVPIRLGSGPVVAGTEAPGGCVWQFGHVDTCDSICEVMRHCCGFGIMPGA